MENIKDNIEIRENEKSTILRNVIRILNILETNVFVIHVAYADTIMFYMIHSIQLSYVNSISKEKGIFFFLKKEMVANISVPDHLVNFQQLELYR